MPVALITGASRGLGLATAAELAGRGWSLVVDARRGPDLSDAVLGLPRVTAIAGDVTSAGHRAALAAEVSRLGRLDLLVNNASTLGPSPLPWLTGYDLGALRHVYETNVLAPLALIQLLAAPLSAAGGTIVDVSSDAAVEAYEGWGGYGSSKAALDQLTAVLAAENPALRCYAFDPGDMRTEMHQQAFPGEDISDRPEPEAVVPALLRLITERPPSGRYRAAELAVPSQPMPAPAPAPPFPAEVTS
jgi:NAD(P)-dependent dehydrogenase (short-subunit alcohol dehydrogenase family)